MVLIRAWACWELNFFMNNLMKEVFPIPAGPHIMMLSCRFLDSLEVTLLMTSLIWVSIELI